MACPGPSGEAGGTNYTYTFYVGQTGNVGTDGTAAASVCCTTDAVTASGAGCVTVTAAQFQAGSTLSLTCPAGQNLLYSKLNNAGGSCCGGYTRTIYGSSYNVPVCE